MKRIIISFLIILCVASNSYAQILIPQPNKKGLWGYVDEKGKYKIKPIYQAAGLFSSGLACVKKGELYGYINSSGEVVIPAVFDTAESFNGNFAKCSKNEKFGLLSVSGDEFIKFEYDELRLSDNKRFYVGKKYNDGKIYVIAIINNAPLINAFDEVSYQEQCNFAYVKEDGRFGYLGIDGDLIIKTSFTELPNFSTHNIAITHSSDGYGLIDTSLNRILPEKYEYVKLIESGFYLYGDSSGSFGIVSQSGKVILPTGEFSNPSLIGCDAILCTDNDNKRNIIDKDGTVILASCDVISINGDIAEYSIGKEQGKLNLVNGKRAICLNGREIWSAGKASKITYEKPFVLWEDCDGKEHRMNMSGCPVFEDYSSVKRLSNGFYVVEKDEMYALANTAEKILTEWVYGIVPIMDDYVLLKSMNYDRLYCAIFRTSTCKMVTGYDFNCVYQPEDNGLIPVRVIGKGYLSYLKMNGDSFYLVGEESEGYYSITDPKTRKMGVMTEKGKILVSPKYDEVGMFQNGMCRVWILERGNGFINTSGNLVIPCKYPEVLDFGSIQGVKNYTQVWDNYGQSYYIDKKGNIANPDKVIREAYNSQRNESLY